MEIWLGCLYPIASRKLLNAYNLNSIPDHCDTGSMPTITNSCNTALSILSDLDLLLSDSSMESSIMSESEDYTETVLLFLID